MTAPRVRLDMSIRGANFFFFFLIKSLWRVLCDSCSSLLVGFIFSGFWHNFVWLQHYCTFNYVHIIIFSDFVVNFWWIRLQLFLNAPRPIILCVPQYNPQAENALNTDRYFFMSIWFSIQKTTCAFLQLTEMINSKILYVRSLDVEAQTPTLPFHLCWTGIFCLEIFFF